MSKLARAGLVFTTKDGFVIPDLEGLRARSEGRRATGGGPDDTEWSAAA